MDYQKVAVEQRCGGRKSDICPELCCSVLCVCPVCRSKLLFHRNLRLTAKRFDGRDDE